MRSRLIVHVTAEFRDSTWGGIATNIDLSATAMARDGFDVLVVSCGASSIEMLVEPRLLWVQVDLERPNLESLYRAADRVGLGKEVSAKLVEVVNLHMGERRTLVFVHNEEFVTLVRSLRRVRNVEAVLAVSHGLAEQEHPGDESLIAQQDAYFQEASAVCVHSEAQAAILGSAGCDSQELLLVD